MDTAPTTPNSEPTRAELLAQIAELLAQIAALEARVAFMPAIEQAKGGLMVTYGLSADAAFALLRFHSQQHNVKLRAIADELATLLNTMPTTTDAITRFDRLLDDVTRQLRHAAAVAHDVADTQAERTAPSSSDGISVAAPADLALQPAAIPPGVTIASSGPDRPLIYANDAFLDITGYPLDDVLGRNCRFLQGPTTDPAASAALGRALRAGVDATVIIRNYRRDGTPFWNEVSISPIRDRVDRITHFIGTQIDLTNRADRVTAAGDLVRS